MNWKYFEPKFEYEEKFQDANWPWAGHKYFAYDLIRNIKPKKIVELGTHQGTSLFSFCQAAKDYLSDIEINAIDTWQGDKHSGSYNDSVYDKVQDISKKFYLDVNTKILRMTFNDALKKFKDKTIDILHIDGLHTYEAVKNDFWNWFPKVCDNGIILIHDTQVREKDFGVYKFWNEIKKEFKTIEFFHSFGLGIIFKNNEILTGISNIEKEFTMHYSYIHEIKKSLSIEQKDNKLKQIEQELYTTKNSFRWKIPNYFYKLYKNNQWMLSPKLLIKKHIVYKLPKLSQKRIFSLSSKLCLNHQNNFSRNFLEEKTILQYEKAKVKYKKRILLVSHNLNLEGAPLVLFDVGRKLKEKGYFIEVLSPTDGPLKKNFKKQGIPVYIEDFINQDFNFTENDCYDLYFINTLVSCKFIKKLNLSKDKVFWFIHESERDIYFKHLPDLDYKMFQEVNKVIFSCNATKNVYSDLLQNNSIILNNGVDLGKIDYFISENSKKNVRSRLGFEKSDVLVNLTASICRRKGQMGFVEAAIKILEKANSSKLKFLVIGSPNKTSVEQQEYFKKVKNIVDKSEFKSQILFVGTTEKIFEYYLISDIYVCNSFLESFPRVILEAMAFSLPIIATKVFGIPEQIEDQESGFLIEAGSTTELASKIEFLIKNKDKAQLLGRNARKRVEKIFNLDVILEQLEKIIVN